MAAYLTPKKYQYLELWRSTPRGSSRRSDGFRPVSLLATSCNMKGTNVVKKLLLKPLLAGK